MKTHHRKILSNTIAALAAGILSASGAVQFAEVQSTSDTAYDASASTTDLVNQGTSSFQSGVYAPSYGEGTWNADGINDGLSSTTITGETALYGLAPGNFPATSTITLNVAVNTLGYDLTSITSIAGWNHGSIGYGNQKLTVEYSVVGSAAFTTLFADHSFGNLAGTGATKVVATSDSGVLATGVDAIRVTYQTPTGGRSLIREFDVQGVATVAAGVAQVENLPATLVAVATATANGNLISNGNGADSAALTIYWGTTDGGINPLAWNYSLSAGSRTSPGTFSAPLSGLSGNTTYFYRAFASNSLGTDWAPTSESFTTLADPTLPVVENLPPTMVDVESATANGNLLNLGSGAGSASVMFYWGTTDGGTNPLAWATGTVVGSLTAPGAFNLPLSGLAHNTTYYYRAFASNTAGDDWAPSSASFTTIRPGGAKTVNVNFGGTTYTGTGAAADTGTAWTTTWAPDPAGRSAGNPDLRSLPASDGSATCMGLNHNYPSTGTSGTPAIALFSSYLHNNNTPITLTLSGLHSATTYDLFFYGARQGTNETLTVTLGGVTKTMVTQGNTSSFVQNQNFVRFAAVTPDAHGEVAVTLGGGTATVNLLCGLQIEEVTPVALRQTVPKRDFIRRLRNGENLKFTFLGTSLTNGTWKWAETFGEWLDETFPGKTSRSNFGWGASASSEPVGLPYGMRRLLPALDVNPDVLCIEFAMNDSVVSYGISPAQSRANIEGMIDAVLRDHPNREVVIVTTNPCKPGSSAATDRPQLSAYYQLFRDIADERQLLVIDHYWNWQWILQHDPALFDTYIPDTVHPQYPGLQAVTKPEYQRTLLGENLWGSPYDGTGSRTLFLWHLDQRELAGLNLPAAVGTADMVLTHSPLLVPGRFNEGITPNGVDPAGRAVSVAAGAALKTGAGAPLGEDPSLTIECRFRIGQTGVEQVLISKREAPLGGTPHQGLSLWVGADNHLKASWGFGDRSVVLSADAVVLATGHAYHAAMVWDGDVETARLYLDGTEQATQQVANAVLSLDDQALVLANSSASPWLPLQGVIDEVRITTKDDPFTTSVVNTASYSDWAWDHLGLAAIRAGDADKDADADGDGDSNGKEQLFGGDGVDPVRQAVPPMLAMSGAGPAQQAGFSYRRLAQGAEFRLQASEDLIAWKDITAAAVEDGAPLVHGDGTETVRYLIGSPSDSYPRRFFRAHGDWEDSYIPPLAPSLSVAAFSGQYANGQYGPANTIDGSLEESTALPRHYWLTPDGQTTGWITYDFAHPFELTKLRLANTHNTIANDRGAKGYRITAGNTLSGGKVSAGTLLATGNLATGVGPTPPSGDATFETVWTGSQAAVRYVTVEITSMADWASAGTGLNEVEFSLVVP